MKTALIIIGALILGGVIGAVAMMYYIEHEMFRNF